METSDPDIFAVGECVEHRGQSATAWWRRCYEQGKVLAATITGNRGAGLHRHGAGGEAQDHGRRRVLRRRLGASGAEPVRYEDSALGVYKKLAVKDGKLAGVILVGDTSDSHRYMDWLRTGADIGDKRGQLLFPPPSADAGLDVAEMSDSATVCGCVGVTKGTIIAAIHEHGVNTISQLKESTRACTGCGSCTSLCQDLLRAVAPDFEDEKKKVICACVPFARGSAPRDPAQPEAQVGAGGARDLRQRHRLRDLQAGAELHARHAVVRRSRRGPLGALHQRSRARQHSEGRHVLGRAANPRRCDQPGRTAPHRRRRGQIPRADGEDHRQPAHRSAGHQEGRPAEGVGRSRHAVGPGVHQGRAHGEDLRRHRVLPLRHAGLDRARASRWSGASSNSSRRTR